MLNDSVWGKRAPRLTNVVVLTPDGARHVGKYDGCGMQLKDYDSAKFVLQELYESESFDQLPESGIEPGKGLHYDREFVAALETVRGFKTHRQYCEVADYYHLLLRDRVNEGFRALGLPETLEAQWYSVYSVLEQVSVKFPPSIETLLEAYPSAAEFLPKTFEELRAAGLKFSEAFSALATSQANNIVSQFGLRLKGK